MHEKGGFGSIGWQYNWNHDEAEKNILRTHTTAVSSRVLYKLAEQYKKIEAPSELEQPLVISGKHTFQTQCKNVLAGLSERKRNLK